MKNLFTLLSIALAINFAAAQTLMDVGPQTSTYTGDTRGYWFTAPTDFVITGLRVPTDASVLDQNIQVVKFDSIPPVWTTVTNNFTTLALFQNVSGTSVISVSIVIQAGDIIGILGERGTVASYGDNPYSTSIAGFPVTLTRLGFQDQLQTISAYDVWQTTAGSISRVEMYYVIPQSCQSITTTFAGPTATFDGNMFDIVALNDMIITGFDGNILAGTATVEIYYKTGSYLGYETDPGSWARIDSVGGIVTNGAGVATPIPIVVNIPVKAGDTVAFYITTTGTPNIEYSTGTLEGSVYVSDANLQLLEGNGKLYPFGTTAAPRVWNGTVYYQVLGIDEFIQYNNINIGNLGETGNSEFFGQSFYADIDTISMVGAWLVENVAEGEVRLAIAPDDGLGNPDETAVLWQSALINPDPIGRWFVLSGLSIPVIVSTKYWVLIDGMNGGAATGYSNVGYSSDTTDTGEIFKYSNDDGVSWGFWVAPLAVFVGGSCILTLSDDVGVIAIDAPTSGCDLTATELVTVRVKNFGSAAQSAIPVSFDDGTGIITETIAGPLNPGDTITYNFTATSDLSVPGTYTFDAWTSLVGDADSTNDSITNYQVANSGISINTFPYTEDFESGTLGAFYNADIIDSLLWVNTEIRGSDPGHSATHSAYFGNPVDTSYNTGAIEGANLTLPCIDLSLLTNVQLIFNYFLETENLDPFDAAQVLISTDGVIFDILADNQATIGNLIEGTGVWQNIVLDISAYAGNPTVYVRFSFNTIDGGFNDFEGFYIDDIYIGGPIIDIGVVAIDAPVSGCGLTVSESVTVRVKNLGSDTVSTIPVSYRINGGAPVIEVIVPAILPGDTSAYTFTTTADLSVTGTYIFDAWTNLAGDIDNSNDSTTNYTVDNITSPTVDLGPDATACDSIILDAGNPGATYFWSTGEITQLITVTVTDIYFVEVTLSGCTPVYDTINVTVNPSPIVDLGSDTTVCIGILLDVTTGGATYNWSDSSTNPTLLVSTSGTYWVDVTVAGCTTRDSIDVIVNSDPPVVNLGPDTTVCSGIVLDGGINPGATFAWSTGDTTQTIFVSISGTYSVDVTNTCTSVSDTVTITVIPVPIVDLGSDTTVCIGILLDVTTGGATYNWSDSSTNPTLLVSTSGTYWVDVTVSGCTTRDSINIIVNTGPPVVNLGPDTTVCSGIVLDGGANPGATFAWNTGDTTQTIFVSISGTYSVDVTNACTSVFDTVTITVIPVPVVDLGNDTIICPGDTVILDATTTGVTYSWSTGDTISTITVNTTGTYSVVLTDTVTWCTANDTIVVTVSSGATALFIFTTAGLSVTFTNNSLEASSYFWDYGDGVGTSTMTSETYTYATAGTYDVTLVAINPCGSDTIIIPVTVTTGIDENNIATEQINVYPNPNEGVFTISFTGFKNEKVQLAIIDMQGRSVIEEQLAVNNELNKILDISSFSKGMYFLRVITSYNVLTRKILVE